MHQLLPCPAITMLPIPISLEKFVSVALAFVIALVGALVLTPVAMRLAQKAGVMSPVQSHHIHTRPTPRWGGLAMYAAFVVMVLLLAPLHRHLNAGNLLNPRVLGILIGGGIITAIGALDDKYNLPAKVKLGGQILAAAILVYPFGVRMVVAFGLDLPAGTFWMDIVGALLTIVWVVAVTNMINLIDGLDGLAAGVAGLAALTFVVIALTLKGTIGYAILAAGVVGVCLGFLHYNFNPARVFMGDAGSHFLGYTIAALSILQNWKIATGIAFSVPFLILAVPIFDTTFAIIRRLRRRQPIFSPDKGHLHHRLLNMGLHQRSVVLTIYLLTSIGCLLALLLARARIWEP